MAVNTVLVTKQETVIGTASVCRIHRASTGTKYTVRGAICTRGARTLVVEESAALSRDLKKYIDHLLS